MKRRFSFLVGEDIILPPRTVWISRNGRIISSPTGDAKFDSIPFFKVFGVRTLFGEEVCVFLTPFDTAEIVLHFFFDTRSAKKKLSKRNADTRALPLTHHLLKKVDENFVK
jgi:hypothetical protein